MRKLSIGLILLTVLVSTFAHEYILIADKFRVSKGDTLEMHLFVADGFNIELERPIQTSITRRFELINEKGVTDLLKTSTNGTLPVLKTTVDFTGPGLITMERDYARINLPNRKFLDYLKEDHIEGIRISDNPEKLSQSERYSRYIKSLVQSGTAAITDTLHKKRVGHRFEIVLLDNPYLLKTGDLLRVQVLFKNMPLSGKVITARNRTGNKPSISFTSRTDKTGKCTFRLTRGGDWFIHATHMISCPEPADSDWESFWASYSFGLE